ncbi:MAG TPA: DUF5916 domain-containing protein [Gemmatimonadales bacterium]|jgi:hypothetical protein|nr:DUF5916 domain-containing protein [Gemmatimonadales bacterium]
MLPALLLLLQTAGDPPRVYDGRSHQVDVPLPRIEATVRIDGVLDEAVWGRAARLTGFSQYRPVDSRPAEDSTDVLVWYAPDAVYFGIRAYEAHGAVVRATLADRDHIEADDRIQILLDTYNDHRRAWLFAVNPLGAQQDGVWSDGVDASAGGPSVGFRFDATIDLNPDFVFQSRGRLTLAGYEVEVRIPFKSLRYQAADPQAWGLQIMRVTQHTGYEDTWTPAIRASASFLIQSGRLAGLTRLQRGLVMDLTPEVTTKVDGRRRPPQPYLYTAEPDVGGNLRWGVTQNLSLSATANPDFSQVEADVGQILANERFPLFFPEKRPFFLEGLEQYDTPNRLIYTRRIVQPVAGAKLTGKVGGTNVAFLSAADQRNAATDANPVFNILRVRRDLGASSTTGLIYTDRIEDRDYNRLLGADVRVVWRKIWFSQAQIVGSWTQDAAGARAGTLWDVTFYDRTGRSYGNHAGLLGASPDFEAASGFVPRTNFVVGRFFNRFTWYGRPGALVEQVTTFTGLTPLWRYDDFLKLKSTIEGGIESNWLGTLRGGWGLNVRLADDQQRFDSAAYASYRVDSSGTPLPFPLPHGLYNLLSASAAANTPNRAFSAGVAFAFGAVPIFAEAAEGRQFSAQTTLAWRPTPSIRLEARWNHRRITRAAGGSRFSRSNIPRLKLEYQLTRSIFFRYVGQYTAEQVAALRDPRTGRPLMQFDPDSGRYVGVAATSRNDFRSDVLFSYKPTPGTLFFFGYGSSLSEPEAFAFRDLRRASDGLFLKASYLFRM